MAATNNSGLGHGTNGFPQQKLEEQIYALQVDANENTLNANKPPVYEPSPKHDKGGWGSNNIIKTQEEGQSLLDTGYHDGKQVYNVTDSGVIVKFQPNNTPSNGYHSYEVSKPRDIPIVILKQMLVDGKISRIEYNKIRKGKK